jgi:hypothetical protein
MMSVVNISNQIRFLEGYGVAVLVETHQLKNPNAEVRNPEEARTPKSETIVM